MIIIAVPIGLVLLVLYLLLAGFALYHINKNGNLPALLVAVLVVIIVGALVLAIPCTGFQQIQFGNFTVSSAKCATLI